MMGNTVLSAMALKYSTTSSSLALYRIGGKIIKASAPSSSAVFAKCIAAFVVVSAIFIKTGTFPSTKATASRVKTRLSSSVNVLASPNVPPKTRP